MPQAFYELTMSQKLFTSDKSKILCKSSVDVDIQKRISQVW